MEPTKRDCRSSKRKQARDKRREAGLCVECGKPSGGRYLCDYHVDLNSARNIEKRSRRRNNGDCPDCGVKKSANSVFCSECVSKRSDYYLENREHLQSGTKKRRQARKRKVFEHYGLLCKCCGESEYEFLTVDHIYGGGSSHRKEVGGCLYRWLIENKFPEDIQTLCYNCNMSRRFQPEGICIHVQRRVEGRTK